MAALPTRMTPATQPLVCAVHLADLTEVTVWNVDTVDQLWRVVMMYPAVFGTADTIEFAVKQYPGNGIVRTKRFPARIGELLPLETATAVRDSVIGREPIAIYAGQK